MDAAGSQLLPSPGPHIRLRVLPVARHRDAPLRLLLIASLTALAALTAFPVGLCASLPAAKARAANQHDDVEDFAATVSSLPDLGSSQPRNGTIVVYRGVDTSRGKPFSNVTAFVNVFGDGAVGAPTGSNGASSSNGEEWGYQIVNASISGKVDFPGVSASNLNFAGYTSYDYATIAFRYSSEDPDKAGKLAYIDAGSGYCINFTQTESIASSMVIEYFAKDTLTLNFNTTWGVNFTYHNVDLRYIEGSDPSNILDQDTYFLIQTIMNSNHALNATSESFFNLGPHGPYPLDYYGYPVVLRNDAGEVLRPLAAAPPAGKGSVHAWTLGAFTSVVTLMTCLAAAAVLL